MRYIKFSGFSSICGVVASIFSLVGAPSVYAATKAVGCEAFPYSNLTDNRVFNWLFYLNANADLNEAGYRTPDVACSHWVNGGAAEGRQAHPGFSSVQYLYNNPDVKNSMSSNFNIGAINHWISFGISEGRVGYADNGINKNFRRSTISNYDGSPNYKIFVSVSERTAGAIDSLMVNNVEYINSVDHGRQAQLALVAAAHGQGWNPTEAGNCLDDRGYPTSAILNTSSASGNVLSTSNNPAFWEEPGDTTSACVTGNGSYYTPAVNTTIVASNMDFKKNVQIGTQVGSSYLTNVISFASQIVLRAAIPGANTVISSPSMNLAADFRNASIYNPSSSLKNQTIYYGGHLSGTVAGTVSIPAGGYSDISGLACFSTFAQCQSNSLPLILSKGPLANATDAVATCSKSYSGPGVNYGNVMTTAMADGNAQSIDPTTGLNTIFNVQANFPIPNTMPLQTYIVVGHSTPQASAASQVALALNMLYSSGLCTLNTVAPF